MTNKIFLTDYLPNPAQIAPEDILSARQRLATYLASWLPELDTRPNSVFGDIHLTPLAILVAAIEIAQEKRDSDLDLATVASGRIFNSAFVTKYLKTFGITDQGSVPSTGVIRLNFSTNTTYSIDGDAEFIAAGKLFRLILSSNGPLTIYPTDSSLGKYVLARQDIGQFSILLPVIGDAGSIVPEGTVFTSDLDSYDLLSITAAGDFDSGKMPATLPELASRALQVYPAANLGSRSGVVSFLASQFPEMLGASAVLTGDTEMLRDTANILGVSEGAVDIYVRSSRNYLFGESLMTLAFDVDRKGWVGKLSLPATPAFFARASGVFQVTNFRNSGGMNTVFSKSNHPTVDNLGVAYSKYETLGILIQDDEPENFVPGYVGPVTQETGQETTLQVTGEYFGNIFHANTFRNVSLFFDSPTTVAGLPAVLVSVRDNVTGESATTTFVPNTEVNPGYGVILKDAAYTDMFKGLDLSIIPVDGGFDVNSLLGLSYNFEFRARTANFAVDYMYDSALTKVDAIVENQTYRPAAVSVLAKSFVVCNIENLTVNYRVPFGSRLDIAAASARIVNYVNGIVYPNTFEDSAIGTILLISGASGVQSVLKQGTFYPSLANVYVDANGVESPIPRYATTTLIPPVNSSGFGVRNTTYLIAAENITFISTGV